MTTILDRIVHDTRERLCEAKRTVSFSEWERRANELPAPRSLARALRKERLAIIAEIKKRSPSQGLLRNDFNAAQIALQYEVAGADAVSVLTEPHHFGGALGDIESVNRHISVPILRKDFIVDPYQIAEARASGADAVLLIAAVLDGSELRDLQQTADEFGLDCLVEVYDVSELKLLDFDIVKILGVNNRDLRTFDVDVERTLHILRDVPPGVIRVSESGLCSAAQLAHLWQNEVDAALIGGSLMSSGHPGHALRSLVDGLIRITPGIHVTER